MDYQVLKHVHMGAVALSIGGFALRGYGACRQAHWVRTKAVKVLPHLVDTVLLASAVTLAVWADLAPWRQGWFGAKMIGLLIYIGLGVVVMRQRGSPAWRWTAWVLALAVAGAMVWLAHVKPAL